MAVVRQAHMPGNYELYDSSSNMLGPVICKDCWEQEKKQTTAPLETVWVSVEGWRMVWWLCRGHADLMKARRTGPERYLKSVRGVVKNPQI
jgi:hypothetical protein